MDRIIPILGLLITLGFFAYRNIHALRKRRLARTGAPAPDGAPKRSNAEAAAKLGLLPAERIDTGNARPPSYQETAVLGAVRAGDWQTGARYLAEPGRDWQERRRRLRLLGENAAHDDAWLLAWRRAHPRDPAAVLVDAESLIHLAWNVRGSGAAELTTREQFANFRRVLDRARETCRDAQALGGADPCPYIVEISLAMGLGYPHADFQRIWAEIVRRDPWHLAAHTRALQYWCEKWRGSHEAALSFAREAAAKGAPGQLLSVLPLHAHLEIQIAHADLDRDEYYKRPEIVAAVDATLGDTAAAAAADPHDPRLPEVRHMLAFALYWQDRFEAALEQFRLVDGWIGSLPWVYYGDPVKEYVHTRNYTAAQVVNAAGFL